MTLWVHFHESLSTFDMLMNGEVRVEEELCLYCKKELETAEHILMGCQFANEVWSHFIKAFKICWMFPGTVKKHFQA